MINLPKPPQILVARAGDAAEKIGTLTNYLATLVSSLETTLGSLNIKDGDNKEVVVKDIAKGSNELIVVYTDKSTKKIPL